jgi:hypothetical protein
MLREIFRRNHSRPSDSNSARCPHPSAGGWRLQLEVISDSEHLSGFDPASMFIQRQGQSPHLEPNLGGDWCSYLW